MSIRGKKISADMAKILKILPVLVALFFLMSLAMATSAQAFSVTGKVVSIDRDSKVLSVAVYYGPDEPLAYSGGPDRINRFALKPGSFVMKGNTSENFRDIRIGDWVTVNYYETGSGLTLADGIAITSAPAGYIGETAQLFSIPGKVVAVNRETRTLTLDPSYYGPNYTGGLRVFAMDNGAAIMIGNEPRNFDDIRVGDWVTVNYRPMNSGPALAEGIAITAPPAPYLRETAGVYSIPGKVVAIDRVSRTLTLDPSYCYSPNYSGDRVFAMERGTVVMMGNEPRNFNDIRIGDWVTVNYHQERNGLVITDGIAFTSPSVLSCPERQG